MFVLGDANQVFYDDRNTATTGKGDYALVTDFNTSADVIQLKGTSDNYVLAPSPAGLPAGTAIYLNKLGSEPEELIAIVQGSTSLSLDGDYFTFTAEFDLADLNGKNGFQINGINKYDSSGASVSSAGDVNGDGFDDILIGATGDPNGQNSGESYVVFGKPGGFGTSLNLSQLNGRNGFVVKGSQSYDLSGTSISAADINGDGFSDILIGNARGSRYNQNESRGYVVFGKAQGFAPSLNLSDLDGSNGFALNEGGSTASDFVGIAGDINGDGFDDMVVGSSGKSSVVFGKAGGFGDSFNFSNLNGRNGFVINGIGTGIYDGSGISSSRVAGDVNGDGLDDLIIGSPYGSANDQTFTSQTYVVFGRTAGFDASINVSALDGSNGFVINGIDTGNYSGAPVSSAGDVNGDGFDDLLIGAINADPNGQNNAGESYVVFGKVGGFSANFNPSTLNGNNGFKINGINEYDHSGNSVSSAGDVNGDGFDDLLIGAINAGGSYVVFGSSGEFSVNFNLSTLNGSNGFKINGLRASVSAAGDVNGDGFDDI